MSAVASYRDQRWNVRVAGLVAFHGACLGVVPMIVAGLLISDDAIAVPVMLVVLVTAALIPAVRALRGRVEATEDQVTIVNPFRTIHLSREEIVGFGDAPLWQNFLAVAAIQVNDPKPRLIRVAPVPATDAPQLERLVTAAPGGRDAPDLT